MENTISKGTEKLDEKAGIKLENNKTFEKQILDNAPKGGVLEQVKNERDAEKATPLVSDSKSVAASGTSNTKYSLSGVSGPSAINLPSIGK